MDHGTWRHRYHAFMQTSSLVTPEQGSSDRAQWNVVTAETVARRALKQRGLCGDVTLMRFGSNGVFHSQSNDLVVRVSNENRDVGFRASKLLAERGLDVLGPVISQAPDQIDGFHVLYWPYKQAISSEIDFRHLGTVVRQVHDSTPWLAPALGLTDASADNLRLAQFSRIEKRLKQLDRFSVFSSREIKMLWLAHAELTKAWEALVWPRLSILHGDVIPGNVVMSVSNQYLLDLDDICIGPVATDHASMLTQVRFFGLREHAYHDFTDGYGHDFCDDVSADILVQIRALSATTWFLRLAEARVALVSEARRRMSYWATGQLSEPWMPA